MLNYRETIYHNYFSTQVNKQARDYKSMLEEQTKHNSLELIKFLPKDKSCKIVDLGCGFGTFVKPAMDAGYTNVIGYDISEEQVKVANSLGLQNVKHCSIDEFFTRNEKADIIVGLDIIEHFTKDELIQFLHHVKNTLNDGGKAIFRTPNLDAPQTSVYAYGDFSHEVFLTKSSALQVMKALGFSKVHVSGGLLKNTNPILEFVRKAWWWKYKTFKKMVLFASGRTWHNVIFEPNLLIEVEK